jgi:hypothetical protein
MLPDSGEVNREAVTNQSPGLLRFAATLGKDSSAARNPEGVVPDEEFYVCVCYRKRRMFPAR